MNTDAFANLPANALPGQPKKPTVGVVGCGYWGKNLVRNFYELGALAWVCDSRPEVLAGLKTQYPGVQLALTVDELLKDPTLDALVVATPSLSHYSLAQQGLLAGKHVYVEKPLATTEEEAELLLQTADQLGLKLMVGHLLVYHPAMNRLRQLIETGELGEIQYLQSDRLNYNVGRNDRNVMWDLMPHDLAAAMYLLNANPVELSYACGVATGADKKLDQVSVGLVFEGKKTLGTTVQLNASWVYPKKQVQLIVKGSKASAILDDTLPGEQKLSLIKQNGVERLVEHPPYLDLEPLKLECQHWLGVLQNLQHPLENAPTFEPKTDGQSALTVVRWLEQAQTRMDQP